jgi:ribonuclease HI
VDEVITTYTDGACRGGNPGFTSCGFVVYNGTDEVHKQGFYLGPELFTNNWAEFQGVICALNWAAINEVQRMLIFCDSKLVVNTINEEWKLGEESLIPLRDYARALLIRGNHSIQHIKGHAGILGNEVADAECNRILDEEGK